MDRETYRSLVVEGLPLLTDTLFPSAEGAKVLRLKNTASIKKA
jgi:hypothetical protein